MSVPVAELEISIRRGPEGAYEAELIFSGPEDDADTKRKGTTLPAEELAAVRGLDPSTEAYGTALFRVLLSDPLMLAQYTEARTAAEAQGAVLRVRLSLDAPELHNLRWEALRDPDTGALLFTGDRVAFSRFISTSTYRPLRRRPRSKLRALVVIASPSDLHDWKRGSRLLGAIDADEEEARARAALEPHIQVRVLRVERGTRGVGLQQIVEALRSGDYDILYLVCHGAWNEGDPLIWLEHADGRSDVVQGIELVRQINELRVSPRLVVLASCQSAGEGGERHTDDRGVLAALGPRLAGDAGVPAVLAMQGDLSLRTAREFIPEFFRSLADDGQLDRAAASARGRVRERSDAWVPILFMRFKGGGIWYEKGFSGEEDTSQLWGMLVDAIVAERCTPVLGPGVSEPYIGARDEMASALADRYKFPLAATDRGSLPDVAQYVEVEYSKSLLERELISLMVQHAQTHHASALSPDTAAVAVRDQRAAVQLTLYQEILLQVWRYQRPNGRPDPYTALAQLPFPLFLTTDFDDLMRAAIVEVRRHQPRVEVCRWRGQEEEAPPAGDIQQGEEVENSRVYHLFGKVGHEGSLVVTRADYYDALIAFTERETLPQAIRTALARSALLFLGFRLSDPSFLALFRFIMSLQGSLLLRNFTHVAVQIDPEEQTYHNPRAARRYLARYFGEHGTARVRIYWGSTEDFVSELLREYEQRIQAPRPDSAHAGPNVLGRAP